MAVLEGVAGEAELPDAVGGEGEGVGFAVPVVEVADEGDGAGVGGPFADDPLVGGGLEVDAGSFVAGGVGGEGAGFVADGGEGFLEAAHAAEDGFLVGCEPGVVADECGDFRHRRQDGGVRGFREGETGWVGASRFR